MNETIHRTLRFENCRQPISPDGLSPIDGAQLESAGRLYDGLELSANERLGFGDVDEEEALQFLSLWDLVDEGGVCRYNAWFYMVDTGAIFRAGTTDVIAEVIQCGLECGDKELAARIFAALDELKKIDPARAKLVNIIPNED